MNYDSRTNRIVEVKSNGAPRFVRSGVCRLESSVAWWRQSGETNGGRRFIPMLVSPYLSPESRAICTDYDDRTAPPILE